MENKNSKWFTQTANGTQHWLSRLEWLLIRYNEIDTNSESILRSVCSLEMSTNIKCTCDLPPTSENERVRFSSWHVICTRNLWGRFSRMRFPRKNPLRYGLPHICPTRSFFRDTFRVKRSRGVVSTISAPHPSRIKTMSVFSVHKRQQKRYTVIDSHSQRTQGNKYTAHTHLSSLSSS